MRPFQLAGNKIPGCNGDVHTHSSHTYILLTDCPIESRLVCGHEVQEATRGKTVVRPSRRPVPQNSVVTRHRPATFASILSRPYQGRFVSQRAVACTACTHSRDKMPTPVPFLYAPCSHVSRSYRDVKVPAPIHTQSSISCLLLIVSSRRREQVCSTKRKLCCNMLSCIARAHYFNPHLNEQSALLILLLLYTPRTRFCTTSISSMLERGMNCIRNVASWYMGTTRLPELRIVLVL